MTERWLLNFLFMALGALGLLFALNLSGYAVRFEQVSVVLPPSRQTSQPAKPVQSPAAKSQVKAPAVLPAPALTPVPQLAPSVPKPSASVDININVHTPPQPAPAPAAPQPAFIIGQPQPYYNSWGWWLVDPNGSFHCPPVSNPTRWTGGMKILVQRPGSPPYETWAPACYR